MKQFFNLLDKEVYFRHLFFGILLSIFPIYYAYTMISIKVVVGIILLLWQVINIFAYPYSRFTYESICNFVIGENFFLINAFTLLLWKFVTMIMCFFGSIFIAPFGLLYLYINKNKK